jgi:hypothetical protein
MNNSNISTGTNPDYLINTLLTIDSVVRYYGVLIHLAFVIVLGLSKDLRSRTLLYVNHATIVNSFYCIITFMYMFSDRPNFASEIINNILCSMSEIGWIFSSYIRMYSILLIAIYRYFAVFKINIYKKLNESLFLLIIPIIVVWAISIIFPLAFKYIFGTTRFIPFCLDGASSSYKITVMYFSFNYIFHIILPLIFIITIYILILVKLKKMGEKVGKSKSQNRPATEARGEQEIETGKRKTSKTNTAKNRNSLEAPKDLKGQEINRSANTKKQKRFANQFILMCFSVLASSFVLSIFSLRNVIQNFLVIFYYWRPVLRIYIIIVISIVPLITMYYNPSRDKLLAMLRLKNSRFINSQASTSYNNNNNSTNNSAVKLANTRFGQGSFK